MADNFDMKKFLTENKLGPYAKAKANEDMGHDIEDAEAEKQMDFLAEFENEAKEEEQFGGVNEAVDQAKVQEMYDKITAVISKVAKKLSDDDASALHDKLKSFFNKLFETKKPVEESMDLNKIASADDKLRRLISNISTNSNIPTADKEGLLDALSELQDFVDEVGFDAEVGQDEEPVSDYSRRRQNELSEASDNPEGDKLVLGFLKRIAKDFDYPVAQAAMFVKERIKKLGY